MVDAIGERGRHLPHGERGVGKTSIAQIVPYLIPAERQRIRFCRVQCFPTDRYASICKKVFKELRFEADAGNGQTVYDVAQLYPGEISPDDMIRELSVFNDNDIPIIVVDEFNEIEHDTTSSLIANTIKALSDSGTNVR